MGYTVLLLIFMLMGVVTCQTTTAPSSANANATSEKAANKDDESSQATVEMVVLNPEESVDKFTFTKADAIPMKQQLQVEDKTEPLKDNADEDDPLAIFETILNDEKESTDGDDVTVTIDKDDDDNSDDDNGDDDDDDDEDEIDDEISQDQSKPLISKPPNLQIRRLGDLDPQFDKKEQDSADFPQSRQDVNNPYITTRDRGVSSDSAADNSPMLQLTQGGYQRPYSRRGSFDNQRPISGIASQQSETMERPVGSQRDKNQQESPQIAPQVTYASAYQPQMDYGAIQMFRHPFDPSGSFMTPNGPLQNTAPNPFFHAQPGSYPEFTSANVQSPFAMPGNGFSAAPRDANGFAQYQTPPMANPNIMFQGQPQFVVQPQPMSDGIQRPVYNPFQPGGFSPYTGTNNVEAAPSPDYSAFFRSASPINPQQFQVNPNFYRTVNNDEGSGFNSPTITGNIGPNNESPFSSRFYRYPVTSNQVPPQNTDQQVQIQQQDPETGTNDQKPRDSEQINVSQDKEDPLSVPFGARIQKQNDLLDQNAFPVSRDVYIRYPMAEAGYATEENLPVQNTTERNTERNDVAKRPFPFFEGGRLYPGFSSPDPYRNALNALQQGYPGESSKTKNEDSNNTKEISIEQLARNIPTRFNQDPVPPASPIYNEYPGRSQDAPVLNESPFYAPAGNGVRSPFDQVPAFPERNYPFSAPEPVGNAVEKNVTPLCAKDSNASLCFKDPEYPRRELLYALNSDSFLLERLVMPDQQLDGIPLVEQNTSESPESQDNYICKSDLKYGMPLRAKNIKGVWKVIVNIERAIGGGKFIQPVRLEVCRAANEPCSFTTELKTACVQKYSLQRLLSWSAEKGVHNDVYKLPVACSCQLVKAQV